MYRYLDRLRENAIYCDTVSVIYIQPRDEPALIETVDILGNMTSELCPSEFISEIGSGGHNSYMYRVMTGGSGEKTSGGG